MIISNINRVSGYIVNNLTLTTSEAQSATWGKTMRHNNINCGAVADPTARAYSCFYRHKASDISLTFEVSARGSFALLRSLSVPYTGDTT